MFEKLLNNEYSYNYNMNRFLIDAITTSRILLGLLFLYVVLFNFNEVYLILIFLLTAISDVGDGWLSRKYCLSTDAGAKFDVICDFIFIMLSTLAMVFHGMIPPWFLAVIILKLIEFFKTSDESLEYEKFGHFVALMFYAFPWVSVLINDKSISLILAIFITVCALISSFMRIYKKVY